VFLKVTNGFRSDWGVQIHAGYQTFTGTARFTENQHFTPCANSSTAGLLASDLP